MLKQAGSYGCAEIGVRVDTPLSCEAPHFLRVALDVIFNLEDGLPPWI